MWCTVFLLINRKSFALDYILNIVAFSTNNVKEQEDKKHNAKPYLSMKKQTKRYRYNQTFFSGGIRTSECW